MSFDDLTRIKGVVDTFVVQAKAAKYDTLFYLLSMAAMELASLQVETFDLTIEEIAEK